jgi:PAS domain S-box-containing protein
MVVPPLQAGPHLSSTQAAGQGDAFASGGAAPRRQRAVSISRRTQGGGARQGRHASDPEAITRFAAAGAGIVERGEQHWSPLRPNRPDPGTAVRRGRPGRPGAVIVNLLDNVARYSSRGTLMCVRGPGRLAGPPGCRRGNGIPVQEDGRIFDRLHRGDNARGTEGKGLGLSTSRVLASRHGGDVIVRSAPGKGSTFVLRRPRAADFLAAVVRSRPDGIVVLDSDCRIVYANPSTYERLGYPLDRLLGQDRLALLPEHERQTYRAFLDRARGGNSEASTVTAYRPDSFVLELEVKASVLALQGQRFFVVAEREVTERRRRRASGRAGPGRCRPRRD